MSSEEQKRFLNDIVHEIAASRTRNWKPLTFLLICGLVASLVFSSVFLFRYTMSDATHNRLDKAYDGVDQANAELNRTYNALNQAYIKLNNTNSQLENDYDNLNETYLSLLTDSQSNKVRNINTGVEYATIQEAINAAKNGSTILVNSGVYHEHLTIDRTLVLLGANREDTIIEGSNNTEGITITADSVIVNGFTVTNNLDGICLDHSNGSTVSGNTVTLNKHAGIVLVHCKNNTISRNVMSFNEDLTPGLTTGDGIDLSSSSDNTIGNNIITESAVSGLNFVEGSNNNTIYGNVIEKIRWVFFTDSSENNTLFHNNFIDFTNAGNATSSNTAWSVGEVGNYWNDYTGLDDGSGGRIAGDGAGDTGLPWHGVDNYPLINPANPLLIFWDNEAFPTSLGSNSTISAFTFDQTNKEIAFNTIGPANTTGYFNITVSSNLLSGAWTIIQDGTDVTTNATINETQTQTNIYLSYNHSNHAIQIIGTHVIPEYSTTSMLLLLTFFVVPPAVLTAKKRANKK